MGCGASSIEQQAMETNHKIDEGLAEDRENANGVITLLLLGAAESGKSTIVKQKIHLK